jgi:transcriptional regulator with XRE-family HTH domain
MIRRDQSRGVADRFGENLRRCRRRVRLSQVEVALRAELHVTQVSLLERGMRRPRIDTLLKLMTAVEATAPELLDGMDWAVPTTRSGAFFVRREGS